MDWRLIAGGLGQGASEAVRDTSALMTMAHQQDESERAQETLGLQKKAFGLQEQQFGLAQQTHTAQMADEQRKKLDWQHENTPIMPVNKIMGEFRDKDVPTEVRQKILEGVQMFSGGKEAMTRKEFKAYTDWVEKQKPEFAGITYDYLEQKSIKLQNQLEKANTKANIDKIKLDISNEIWKEFDKQKIPFDTKVFNKLWSEKVNERIRSEIGEPIQELQSLESRKKKVAMSSPEIVKWLAATKTTPVRPSQPNLASLSRDVAMGIPGSREALTIYQNAETTKAQNTQALKTEGDFALERERHRLAAGDIKMQVIKVPTVFTEQQMFDAKGKLVPGSGQTKIMMVDKLVPTQGGIPVVTPDMVRDEQNKLFSALDRTTNQDEINKVLKSATDAKIFKSLDEAKTAFKQHRDFIISNTPLPPSKHDISNAPNALSAAILRNQRDEEALSISTSTDWKNKPVWELLPKHEKPVPTGLPSQKRFRENQRKMIENMYR